MQKMYEILKKLIQKSKKLYFMHFVVLYLLPSNLITIVAILVTPIIVIDEISRHSINSLLSLYEDSVELVGGWLFIMMFHSICAIILGFVFQIIIMLIQFIRERTLLVKSNFLLNNKIYNKFFVSSVIMIILSWLCLYLLNVIQSILP